MSFLAISEILGLFFNALTVDDKKLIAYLFPKSKTAKNVVS